jgi:Integrase core domain
MLHMPLTSGSRICRLPTANLYLATVIDCYSRRLAGWAIAEHMRTDLVTDALGAARDTRGSLTGAIFHSDHGAQYSAKAFAQLYARLGDRAVLRRHDRQAPPCHRRRQISRRTPTLKSDISESVIHQPMSGAQRVVCGRRGPGRLLSR